MDLISAFARTLSIEAFSTFRILPRIGRIAWKLRSRAVFAEPPAESPSTIKISHSDRILFLCSLPVCPFVSNEYFCLVSIFVLAFSSLLRIWQIAQRRQEHFSALRDCGQNTAESPRPLLFRRPLPHPGCPAFVFVWPSNRGSGCLIEITAVIPFQDIRSRKVIVFFLLRHRSLWHSCS